MFSFAARVGWRNPIREKIQEALRLQLGQQVVIMHAEGKKSGVWPCPELIWRILDISTIIKVALFLPKGNHLNVQPVQTVSRFLVVQCMIMRE